MYKQFLDKYKTREDIDSAIEKLLDIKSFEYNDIKNRYFELFSIYPITAVQIDKTILENGLSVYRTRESVQNLEYTKKESFSYPKNSIHSKTQRANWEGRNVFYASDSLYTSLMETKALTNNNEFYISKWVFSLNGIRNKTIAILPLSFGELPENNPWKDFLNMDLNLKIELLKTNTIEETELIYYFYKCISELFTSVKVKNYHITAFLADQILYNLSLKDNLIYFPILIYPSVANDFLSCNFAISPFFVDKYMRLEKVFKINVTNAEKDRINFNFNQIGIHSSETDLAWYYMDHEKEKDKYKFESISCNCGKKFELSNLDFFIFKNDQRTINHNELISEITKDIDLFKEFNSNSMITKSGLFNGLKGVFKFNSNLIELEFEGEIHKSLTFEVSFVAYINFKKI